VNVAEETPPTPTPPTPPRIGAGDPIACMPEDALPLYVCAVCVLCGCGVCVCVVCRGSVCVCVCVEDAVTLERG